jgi:predicted small lipoprotein YifL
MLGFVGPSRKKGTLREAVSTTMLRQFPCTGALAAMLLAVTFAGVSGCGIKGPLRPAPKAAATPPPPPIDNPATPPKTTSPALPPPSANDRQP